jgi:hypothetical protein
MYAKVGDRLLLHGKIVGQQDRVVEVVAILGSQGTPPFRVRDADGHESIMAPGPDTEVEHRPATS